MTPKTPLPWTELPCYFDNQCQAFEPQDADYMVHACNEYPKLISEIEHLRQENKELDLGLKEATTKIFDQIAEISRLRRHVNIGPGIE